MNVDDRLSEHIHAFLELKRLWQLIDETLKLCSEKEIKNDLLYFQVLLSSLDALSFTILYSSSYPRAANSLII